MARGPKHHLKRLDAPKHWMLDKLGGVFAPRPSTGPHKLRECLPLCLILKNRLRYALTRREAIQIVMRRCILVDHKVRTDVNYPSGFMDVVTISKTDEKFRLLYDVKGRFTVHKISAEESNFKLLKIKSKTTCNKASCGRNTASTGSVAIPIAVTHDGRTVKYVDPNSSIGDTIKFDLTTGKAVDLVKFEAGNVCMVTGGANKGRVGILTSREKHPGSFEIAHLKDRRGDSFVTRAGNVFVIGEGVKPWVSLPRAKGIKVSIVEERDASNARGKKKD